MKNNTIMLLEEEIWCVHEYLDQLKIPREDSEGKKYSIVGRIKQLEKNNLKQISELETFYLMENLRSR